MTSECIASALRWQKMDIALHWLEESWHLPFPLLIVRQAQQSFGKKGSVAGSTKENCFILNITCVSAIT